MLGMNAVERSGLAKRNRVAALRELEHHLTAIAGDPSGVDPTPYFSPEDAEFLQQARVLLDAHRWPKAVPLELRDTTMHWLPRRKPDPTIRDAAGNPITGYPIARLGVDAFQQLIYFCSDGLLRSSRGEELHHTPMRGVGRMPSMDILSEALDPGRRFAADYTTKMRGRNLPQILQKESGCIF